jgi:hypothetical protein
MESAEVKVAKMEAIAIQLREACEGLPFFVVNTCDNLCSQIHIRVSLDARNTWTNGIYFNSRHAQLFVNVAKRKQWYEDGDTLELEMHSGYKLTKMRKSTGDIAKIVRHFKKWIEQIKSEM